VGRHLFRFLSDSNIDTVYQEEIARLVTTDALTGLANRRALVDFLGRELARAARYSRPLSLVMLDIDHFGVLIDQRGRLAGDFALRELATRFRTTVQAEELMVRYAGERFALALPDCGAAQASQAAERLRLLAESEAFTFAQESFALSVSLGVATAARGELPPPSLIMRADRSLCRAKRD
jgi:diguanylate cyclase (GGDEF)-like protein